MSSESNQRLTAFVGPKKSVYYQRQFEMLESKKRLTWNWSAFLFTCYWAAYRKMYAEAMLLFVLVLGVRFLDLLWFQYTGSVLLTFIYAVAVGMLGNSLYLRRYHRVLTAAGRLDSGEDQHKYLQSRGGINPILIAILMLLVVIGFAAIVYMNKKPSLPQAKVVKVKMDLRSLYSALQLYKLDNNVYPSTEQGLRALLEKPAGDPPAENWRGPYMNRIYKDSWGNSYQYLNPGIAGEVDLFSYGADGQRGGKDSAADIYLTQ